MDANRSLDDFDGEDEGTDGADDADGADGANDADDANENTSADEIDPATPTYRWAPAGDACPRCGEAVERRWADDGEFVCAACKEW